MVREVSPIMFISMVSLREVPGSDCRLPEVAVPFGPGSHYLIATQAAFLMIFQCFL